MGAIILLLISIGAEHPTDLPSAPVPLKVVEIARGHSWVSPYWGYSTPKVVFDGNRYYTAGLWGASPDTATGVIYASSGASWEEGAALPDIYQPATLGLDKNRRLIAAYTRKGRPVRLLRAIEPGNVASMEDVPPPPEMEDAYYIGMAVQHDTVYLAYLGGPDHSMFFTTLDLGTLNWTPTIVLQKGQIDHKPKTAWTYPIVFPTNAGIHIVASNSPDGGEGNTYNEVWYLFIPTGASEPAVRDRVAECPVGHLAYAMDMLVDASGSVHVVMMRNRRVYGDPLPDTSPPEGTWYAVRDSASGTWDMERLGPTALAGLYAWEGNVLVLMQQKGTIVAMQRRDDAAGWVTRFSLCPAQDIPAGPSFMDVLSQASGSDLGRGLVVVSEGLLPEKENEPRVRVLWALMPEEAHRIP